MSDSPENRERTGRICAAFSERFPESGVPQMVRAPGRVNLIGEHTDYNDGFVLPIAIDHDVRFAVVRRPDRLVRIHSLDYGTDTEFDLDDIQPEPEGSWGNYLRGMAVQLLKDGRLLHGMDGVMQGNVPIGSGLSSSAATLVAAGLAFLVESTEVVQPRDVALMAQRAEQQFLGVNVGIMDQFVSRMGHQGHALFLDCRSLEFDLIPVPEGEYVFVVANSNQSRELAGSAYNERRAQCEAAVAVLKEQLPEIQALRDVTVEQFEQYADRLEPTVRQRARHVVTENARVLQAVEALRSNDLPRFGKLMNQSHDSLRDDYAVSSEALDCLVDASRSVEGCLGSRLTGAGFGGCTVSLVQADQVEAFKDAVGKQYYQQTGLQAEFYVTRAAPGAGKVHVGD